MNEISALSCGILFLLKSGARRSGWGKDDAARVIEVYEGKDRE